MHRHELASVALNSGFIGKYKINQHGALRVSLAQLGACMPRRAPLENLSSCGMHRVSGPIIGLAFRSPRANARPHRHDIDATLVHAQPSFTDTIRIRFLISCFTLITIIF